MNLSMGNQAETDAMLDSLLQTVGVMRNVFRSMDYVEKRLSELAELKDLDPRLRREVQHLRGAMSEVTSEVMFRLSLMGTIVTDLLKEAEKRRCSDPRPFAEASGDRGRASKGPNRLEIVRAAQR
jgi:hypothetical protein